MKMVWPDSFVEEGNLAQNVSLLRKALGESPGGSQFIANPRGSTGYGQKFERGIVNEWGGKDYQDIMNGLDAARRKYSWIDTECLAVTGGSYGGYMTNWILGQTNRFKAALSLRS